MTLHARWCPPLLLAEAGDVFRVARLVDENVTGCVVAVLVGRRRDWLLPLFYGVNRVQHVVIEAVAAMIAMLAEFEINFYALGQPQRNLLPGEGDRAVIHDLVFAEQHDLRHWPDHLRFDPHDLEFVGDDPGASLEFDWIDLPADVVAVRHVWTVVTLSEMYQPGRLSVQISEPFTAQLEIVTDAGVKDQSQAGKASAGDAARIIVELRHRSPEFIYAEKTVLGFGDGCDVVVFAALCADRIANFVECLMGEVLDRSDTGDVVHEFFDALSGFVDDLAGRALNTLREG